MNTQTNQNKTEETWFEMPDDSGLTEPQSEATLPRCKAVDYCERCGKEMQSSLPHCATCHRELWTFDKT